MFLTHRAAGFSLVELAIAIAIVTFLAILAAPGITDFLVNSRIRNTAEAIANGLRQARMEAVKRNATVQLVLGANAVTIRDCQGDPACAAPLDVYTERISETGNTTMTAAPAGANTVTYSALGMYVNPNPDASLPIQLVDVSSTSIATPHPLRVVVDPALGVGLRMCDPKFALPDPMGCP